RARHRARAWDAGGDSDGPQRLDVHPRGGGLRLVLERRRTGERGWHTRVSALLARPPDAGSLREAIAAAARRAGAATPRPGAVRRDGPRLARPGRGRGLAGRLTASWRGGVPWVRGARRRASTGRALARDTDCAARQVAVVPAASRRAASL